MEISSTWTAEWNPGVACQIPNCKEAFPHDNTFLKRCRICAYHARLPALVLEGRVTRFCNLCKRLHLVDAFEGDKRSCREALEKHNARRRQRRSEDRAEREAGAAARASPPGGTPPPRPFVFAAAVAGAPAPPGGPGGRWVWKWEEGGGTCPSSQPAEGVVAPGEPPAQHAQQRSLPWGGVQKGGGPLPGRDQVDPRPLHRERSPLQPPPQHGPPGSGREYVVQELVGREWGPDERELEALFRPLDAQLLPHWRGAGTHARARQAGHTGVTQQAQQAQQQGPAQIVQSYGHVQQAQQVQRRAGTPPTHPARKRSVDSAAQHAPWATNPRRTASFEGFRSPALAAPPPPSHAQQGQQGGAEQPNVQQQQQGQQHQQQHQQHVFLGRVVGGAGSGASPPPPARQPGGQQVRAVDLRGLNQHLTQPLAHPPQGQRRGPEGADLARQGVGGGGEGCVWPPLSILQRKTTESGPGWDLHDRSDAVNNTPPPPEEPHTAAPVTHYHQPPQLQHHSNNDQLQQHSQLSLCSSTMNTWPRHHLHHPPLPQAPHSLHPPHAPQHTQQQPTGPHAPTAVHPPPASTSAAQEGEQQGESGGHLEQQEGGLLPLDLEGLSMALSELELEAVLEGGEGSLRMIPDLSQMLHSADLRDLASWISWPDSLPAQGRANPAATGDKPPGTGAVSAGQGGWKKEGHGGGAQRGQQCAQCTAGASQHAQQDLEAPTRHTGGVLPTAPLPPASAPPATPSHAQELRHGGFDASQRALGDGRPHPYLQFFQPQAAPAQRQRQSQAQAWGLPLQQAQQVLSFPAGCWGGQGPCLRLPMLDLTAHAQQAQPAQAPASGTWPPPGGMLGQQGAELRGCVSHTSSGSSRGGERGAAGELCGGRVWGGAGGASLPPADPPAAAELGSGSGPGWGGRSQAGGLWVSLSTLVRCYGRKDVKTEGGMQEEGGIQQLGGAGAACTGASCFALAAAWGDAGAKWGE